MATVLFLCTHNSARSQMAEAFLNHLCGGKFKAESAGITPKGINPHVKRAMAEVGINLSTYRSKSIMEFQGRTFDYVVTVCDQAREQCPFFPGEKQIHMVFADPAALTGVNEEILAKVRVVRDEIRQWMDATFCKGNPDAETSPKKWKNYYNERLLEGNKRLPDWDLAHRVNPFFQIERIVWANLPVCRKDLST